MKKKQHVALVLYSTHLEWRTSDGRSGSEPAHDNTSSAAERVLRQIGASSDEGFSTAWTLEIIVGFE